MPTKTYNPSLIGAAISKCSDQFVYHYGEGKVIKFSRLVLLFGSRAQKRYNQDYDLCRKYFGDYVLETKEVFSGKKIGRLQIFIEGVPLEYFHLKDSKIKKQFNDILRQQDRLKEESGSPLDLIGVKGAFRGQLGNILVTTDNRLVIIDTSLFNAKGSGILSVIITPVFFVARQRQNYILKKLSGDLSIPHQIRDLG